MVRKKIGNFKKMLFDKKKETSLSDNKRHVDEKEENIFERYRLKTTEEMDRLNDNKTIFGIFESAEKHLQFLKEYIAKSGRDYPIVESYSDLENLYDLEEYHKMELAAFESSDPKKTQEYELLKNNHAIIAIARKQENNMEIKQRVLIMAYPSAKVMAAFDFDAIAFMSYSVADALWSVRSLDFLGDEQEGGYGTEYIDKILFFMEQEGITDLHMRKNSPYTYAITGRRFSGVEALQERPVQVPVANAIIRALMNKAAQDPFSDKPEIRGLISEKVLGKEGLIERNYRLHVQQQAVKNKQSPSVSLRRLSNASELEKLGLEGLGYDSKSIKMVHELINDYHTGSAIVSGPTNSGKSTLLYTIFLIMAKQYGKRIMTIENPIEIDLSEYLIQLDLKLTENADEEHRMTKEKAMAAFLSHDPDVTAVNEVRTNKEIEDFVDMSLQAHIAFTTLHANDIRTTIKRMIKSGAPMDDIVASLRFAVNQELLDRRCKKCGGTGEDNSGVACRVCRGKGIVGRLPLYEVALFKKSITVEDDLLDLDGLNEQGKIEYVSKLEIMAEYRKSGDCFDHDYRRVMKEYAIPKEKWLPDPVAAKLGREVK